MAQTFDELRRLVEQSEDAHVELKQMASEDVLRELPTRIAAVANAQGGAIIFGVTDDKEFVVEDAGKMGDYVKLVQRIEHERDTNPSGDVPFWTVVQTSSQAFKSQSLARE